MVHYELIPDVYNYPGAVKVLKIIECVTIIATLLFLRVYMRIVLRREFAHINFRLLLIFQPFMQGFGLVLRVVRHIVDYYGMLDRSTVSMLNLFTDIGLSIGAETMFFMAVERVYGMYYVETYEENRSPVFGILLCTSSVVLWAPVMLGWDLGILPEPFVYSLGYLFMILTAVIFVVLPFVSSRAYKKVAEHRYATVSQRFRTARNLKAAQFLMYLSPYKFFTNLFSISMYLVTYSVLEAQWVPLLGELYMIFNAVQLTCQMLLVLNLHETLREDFFLLFRGRRNRIHTIEVKSVSGSRMMFPIHEEQKMHFDQLQHQWNTHKNKSIKGKNDKYRAV